MLERILTKPTETELASRLQNYIQVQCGRGSDVVDFKPMKDGHAGLTYGFSIHGDHGGACILKLAPFGVRRKGNTDVYRQVPLLRALKTVGLPLPAILWASPSKDALGTPFIIMERLPGRTFIVWEPHESFGCDETALQQLWINAAKLLAQVHSVNWQSLLADWEKPLTLPEELRRWSPVLDHAPDPAWLKAGRELEQRLLQTLPVGTITGLVHGDFQPGNILYKDGCVTGLVDWELSCIGPQGLDLGWLTMMSDSSGWDPGWPPLAPISTARLVDEYRHAGGNAIADVGWFHAFANYRMGAIACMNVKLHRTGKRPDDLWERFAPSIEYLFGRGLELLDKRTGSTHRWRTA